MTPLDQETTGACLTCGARELQGICVQGCPKCAHCGMPITGADYETLFRAPYDLRVVTVCYTCYDANPDAATVFDMVRVCELCVVIHRTVQFGATTLRAMMPYKDPKHHYEYRARHARRERVSREMMGLCTMCGKTTPRWCIAGAGRRSRNLIAANSASHAVKTDGRWASSREAKRRVIMNGDSKILHALALGPNSEGLDETACVVFQTLRCSEEVVDLRYKGFYVAGVSGLHFFDPNYTQGRPLCEACTRLVQNDQKRALQIGYAVLNLDKGGQE